MTGYQSKRAAALDKLEQDDFTERLRELCGLFAGDNYSRYLAESKFILDFAPQPPDKFVLHLREVCDTFYNDHPAQYSAQAEFIYKFAPPPAQPEQEPMARDKLEEDAFDAWWDTRPRLNKTNPAMPDSFEYWGWEGWHAALAQPEQELAIGDIRALKHRIHELEGEVIGYKRILDAQPEQEPVAWMYDWFCDDKLITGWIAHSEPEIPKSMALNIRPLYTAPPQRTWVGLTEEDFSAINQSCFTKLQAATSAESMLKEKNNG